MSEPLLKVSDLQGRRTVSVDKPLFTIGRRIGSDLRVHSSDVSRDHAEIVRDGDHCILRDRGSTYGTFVNGEPITERLLTHGDRIRLGRTAAVELIFQTRTATLSTLKEVTSDLTDLRQFAAIMTVLQAVGSGRILSEVLTLVIDSALDVTKTERGFVMLANEQGKLEFSVARGRKGNTLSGTTSIATSITIPLEVFATGKSYVVDDLTIATDAHRREHTFDLGIRRVMCVPLQVMPVLAGPAQGVPRKIGVLYLDSRKPSTMPSPAMLSSLEVFASQAAIAIESARLYAESAEKARVDRDLRAAAEIQRSLLADPLSVGATWDLAAASVPCRTVGGDFYDYLELADGSFAFVVGDVAGKGPPAALLAAAVQSHFVAHAAVTVNPAQAMVHINRALLRRPIEARFATMFYGVLAKDGLLTYCNAGQEPPIVVGRDVPKALATGGPVLGLLPTAKYTADTIQLRPDDTVIVYSDGITEAANVAEDEFGRERLIGTVVNCLGTNPEGMLDTLLSAVRSFSQGTPQADDITALVLRYRNC